MNHLWRFIGGMLVIFLVVYFLYYLPSQLYGYLKYFIEISDGFWNQVLWQPVFHLKVPLVGFLIVLLLIYLAGTLNETRWAENFREKYIAQIPILGPILVVLLSSINPRTREAIRQAKGFVIAPVFGGYKPAAIMSISRIKRGNCLVGMWYLVLPSLFLWQPDDIMVYALETTEKDGVIYASLPSKNAVRFEISGGATLPENALADAELIPLKEFLRSRNLIPRKN